MQRPYLYLLVTDYPYGIGEPFLENELLLLTKYYRKIYLIVPEIHQVDKTTVRYGVPDGVEIIELETRLSLVHKVKAVLKWTHSSVRMERPYFRKSFGIRLSLYYFKLITGFIAMGIAFQEQLKEVLRKHGHKPEEVTFYSYWFTFATLGLTYLKEENPKFDAVTRVHGWDCFYHRNPGNYLPLRPWALKMLDRICPISGQGRSHLLEKIPDADPSKIRVHYLGVDVGVNTPIPLTFKPIRLRILSISFVHFVKRINLIIDALAGIEDVEIDWTHIGSWSPQTAWLQNSAAEKLDQKLNIHYRFTGEMKGAEVQQYLAAHNADFLICTSESEGLPVSMMEAFAYGIPVLSTGVGGIPEIVKDGENGYLMPADSTPEEIGNYIKRLASIDESDYLRLSRCAKKTYVDKFRASINYEKFAREELHCTTALSVAH